MATITTRSGKGSPLTNNEVDANFTNLNTDKAELSGSTFTGNLSLGDNVKLQLGNQTNGDLQIYHDGSNSYISDQGTGNLRILGDEVLIANAANNEFKAVFNSNGAASLYYDGSIKLATTSTGIDVTGSVVANGLTVDGGTASPIINLSRSGTYSGITFSQTVTNVTGAGADLSTYSLNANTGYVWQTTDSGGTFAKALLIAPNRDISFYDSSGSSQNFFWDSSTSRLGLGTTAPAAPLSFGANIPSNGQTIHTYHSGNTRSGLGIVAGVHRLFTDSGSVLSFGQVSTSDGSTYTERFKINADGSSVFSGSVSVGGATPQGNLTIKGSASDDIDLLTFSEDGTNQSFSFNGNFAGAGSTGNTLSLDSYWQNDIMAWRGDGNVNIGSSLMVGSTTAPTHTLHVDGTVKVTGTQTFDVDSGGGTYLAINHTGNESWTWGAQSGSGSDDYLDVGISGGTRAMSWHEDGRVGIGTSSPTQKLDISGGHLRLDDAYRIRFGGGTAAIEGSGSSNILSLITNNTERMRIASNGAVLVGKTSGTAGNTIETNGRISAAAGSNGQPTFNCEGDTNTGINLPESDRIQLITGGTERMRIDSAGNVGIGTSSPTAYGATATTLEVKGVSGSGSGLIKVTGADGVVSGALYAGGSTAMNIGTQTNHAFAFNTNNTERMRISSAGNVGIGCSPPTGVRTKIKGLAEATNLATSATSAALFIEPYSGSSWGLGIGSVTGQKQYIQAVSAAGDGTKELLLQPFGNNVGIGTGSPSTQLHVRGTANNTFIRIDDGTDFTNIGVDATGSFYNTNTNHRFLTNTGGTEAMRIESSGNLLVGTTSAYGTTGTTINAAGLVYSSADGDRAGQFDRTTSDGEIVRFSKAGTTVGSIQADNGSIGIGSGDVGLLLYDAGNRIVPRNNSAGTSDGVIDLGFGTDRFKDFYLSGGVYLGGTGSANKLDDYEEGTWTPAWSATTSTVTVKSATYTKIGNLVTVHAYLTNISPATSADTQLITGLPFTAAASDQYGTGTIVYSGDADVEGIRMLVHMGAAYIYFHRVDGNGASPTRNDWNTIKSSNLPLLFSATYRVA